MNGIRGQLVEVSQTSQANFGGYTPFETQSITRANNTNAYSAGDVIMGADNTEFVFTNASPTGGWIVSVKISTTDTGAIGDFTIHFLTVKPSLFGDGGVFQITKSEFDNSYYGSVTLTMGTTGVVVSAIDTSLRIPYASTGNLRPVLVTEDGITPVAESVWSISLGLENNIPSGFPNAG